MFYPGVILHTDFPAGQVLVAHVLQRFAPGGLALCVILGGAHLGVVQATDPRQELLLVRDRLLLRLSTASLGNAPLCLPIAPHVAQLICGEKWLCILPVQPIPVKHIIGEFGQNSSDM